MNRRDAIKSLAALAGASGITVAPVTTHEAADVTMAILRCQQRLSASEAARIRDLWDRACQGTALDGVKTVVLDAGLDVEIVRGRK